MKQRALGLFALGRRRPVPFREVELQLLSAVASQLGVAVENSRLFEDLTRSYADLGRAQKQLVHRERLAALGELSAVVAHEVRNPLGVIFNSLGSLHHLLRPEGDARLLLEVIQEEADRLNRIVGDLLDFARPAEPAIRAEPLDRLLEDALVAALAQVDGAVEVHREYDPDLPPVPVDSHQIRQARAQPGGRTRSSRCRAAGVLTVRTRRRGGLRRGRGERLRAGHPRRAAPAHLRALLHHQGHRHRPRAGRGAAHRRGARRLGGPGAARPGRGHLPAQAPARPGGRDRMDGAPGPSDP